MRLNISVVIPPEENEEFMSEISAIVDFSDPEGITLESAFKANHNIKEKLEEVFDIKIDIQYEPHDVSILLLESDEEADFVELIENIRACLIEDLESHGFIVNTFSMLFMEVRIPEEHRNTLPSNFDKGLLN